MRGFGAVAGQGRDVPGLEAVPDPFVELPCPGVDVGGRAAESDTGEVVDDSSASDEEDVLFAQESESGSDLEKLGRIRSPGE